jgi:DNA-binding beta-propeller fold protein YncE
MICNNRSRLIRVAALFSLLCGIMTVSSKIIPTASAYAVNIYTFLTKWGTAGSGNGQFNHPWGLAVDSSGKVFVADTNNNRIQVFVWKSGQNPLP